jgi:tRNA (guanine-N7-)-methyltransferase
MGREGKGWSAFSRLAKLLPMQNATAVKNLTLDLIYPLGSVTERINLAHLFPIPQPLEVELGCGDASFLAEYARQHSQINFLGVERLLGRLRKLDRKGRRMGVSNLRGVRIESAYCLEFLLPPNVATALHIYFPDPWPKKKHRKHRLINERFPTLAWRSLAPGGVVYLRTDDEDYFGQMTEVFLADARFQPLATPVALASVLTDFEREFNARGIATRRAAYQRD